jgi:hypothetical protein
MDAIFAHKRKRKKKQRVEDGGAGRSKTVTPIQTHTPTAQVEIPYTMRENNLLAEIRQLKELLLEKTKSTVVQTPDGSVIDCADNA